MKFGSLFAGIGGIDLGLERAGIECAWQVENDNYCQRVLTKHWPDVRRFSDVRECGRSNLEPVDLIAGGFPCQPHSVAGKRRGAEDDRNLWPEFRRVIAELRPRYVLAENVPGIVSTYIDTVLSDLESEGYACSTLNLPAVAFDAPHRRERIFIIAHNDSVPRGLATETWPEVSDPQGRSTKQSVADPEVESIGAGHRSDESEGERRRRSGDRGRANFSDAEISGLSNGRQTRAQTGMGEEIGEVAFTGLERRGGSWWTVEPDVGRVAYGVSSRVDRLRGLGNAVVPQVAEWVGERVMEHANASP